MNGIEGPNGQSSTWYAAEVPSIVAGLEESRAISEATAERAWRLVGAGAYDRALVEVLNEAV
jgi:hypothetical protein